MVVVDKWTAENGFRHLFPRAARVKENFAQGLTRRRMEWWYEDARARVVSSVVGRYLDPVDCLDALEAAIKREVPFGMGPLEVELEIEAKARAIIWDEISNCPPDKI